MCFINQAETLTSLITQIEGRPIGKTDPYPPPRRIRSSVSIFDCPSPAKQMVQFWTLLIG